MQRMAIAPDVCLAIHDHNNFMLLRYYVGRDIYTAFHYARSITDDEFEPVHLDEFTCVDLADHPTFDTAKVAMITMWEDARDNQI
jgi:hypothetical protein